jgi:trk system potassium uptake protein TrkA
VLERDEARARSVAERLGGTLVLHEEGVGRDALLQSGVGEADAFVASAGDDRANLLAALNAKRLGADLCLSVVSREEFVPLVDALEIDGAFSPRLITAEAILRFVHSRALRAMHLLRSGFEALELEVEEGSLIVGRQLGRTGGVLRGCRVGAILRGDEVIIPHVGTEINAGDRVLMLGVDGTLAGVESAFNAAGP